MPPGRDARGDRPRSRSLAASTIALAALIGLSGCTAAGAPAPTATARATPTATSTQRPSAPTAASECAVGAVGRSASYDALPAGTFTQRAAAAAGRTIRLSATRVLLSDFTAAEGTIDGGVIPRSAAGLVGAGATSTVFEIAPGSSTRAADVPTNFPATNQLSVLRVAGDHAVLRGIGVQGTEQGHLYNGLRVDQVHGLLASDIWVNGIPGDGASPPGETFGINDFRTVGSQWSRVVVDGAGVGASGFGVNSSTDIRICDTVSKNNRYGMGFAFWQSSGIRCVDCSAIGNGRAGFNFERITGSNVFVRPVATGNAYGFRISSDQGSARFRIVDPKLTDGHFTVTLPYAYNGVLNRQRASDITLVVGGKVRRDLLRIDRY